MTSNHVCSDNLSRNMIFFWTLTTWFSCLNLQDVLWVGCKYPRFYTMTAFWNSFICWPSVSLLLRYLSVSPLWNVVEGKKRQFVSLYTRPVQIIYFSNSEVGHGRCLTLTLNTAATRGLNYVQLFPHLFCSQGITVAITAKSNVVTSLNVYIHTSLHLLICCTFVYLSFNSM